MKAQLMRSLDRWSNSLPEAMAEQSKAALTFAFADAKHDIALLAAQRDELIQALAASAGHIEAMAAHIEHKPERFRLYSWSKALEARAAIAKATGESS